MITGQAAGPIQLISSAQNFTANWVDLGSEIPTSYFKVIGLWLNIDINDTLNARVRLLAKHEAAGTDEYVLPIKTVGATDVKVDDEYIEFNVDEDKEYLITWDLDNVVPIVQFQISAGTAGTTAGQIDSAYITMGY